MADEQFTDLTKIEIENAQALAALEQLSRAQQEVTANWQAMANAGTSALSAIEARLAGVTTSATTASVAIRALLADMQAMMAMGAGGGIGGLPPAIQMLASVGGYSGQGIPLGALGYEYPPLLGTGIGRESVYPPIALGSGRMSSLASYDYNPLGYTPQFGTGYERLGWETNPEWLDVNNPFGPREQVSSRPFAGGGAGMPPVPPVQPPPPPSPAEPPFDGGLGRRSSIESWLAQDALKVYGQDYERLKQQVPEITAAFEKQTLAGMSNAKILKGMADGSLSAADAQSILAAQAEKGGNQFGFLERAMLRTLVIYYGFETAIRVVTTATSALIDNFAQLDKAANIAAFTTGQPYSATYAQAGGAMTTGAQYGIGATQAIEAYAEVSRVTKDAATQQQLLNAAAQMSILTNQTQAQSLQDILTIQRQWNLNLTDTSQILDVTAMALRNTNIPMADFAKAMEQGSSAGRSLGLDLQQTAGFMSGLMQATGRMEAPRALQEMQRLAELPQRKTDLQHLEDLGIPTYDTVAKQTLPVLTIIDEIKAKWGQLSDAQRVLAAQSIFGPRYEADFASFINNMGLVTKSMDDMKASTGEAQKATDAFFGSIQLQAERAGTMVGASLTKALLPSPSANQAWAEVFKFIGDNADNLAVGISAALNQLIPGFAMLTRGQSLANTQPPTNYGGARVYGPASAYAQGAMTPTTTLGPAGTNAGMTPPTFSFAGGMDVSKLSLQEYNQEMVLANQLANAQLTALTAAGIPTDDLTKKWDSTVRVMMLANGQIEVMTGKTAALSTVAEQLMNIYNKPTVQANPELNQITAPRLQNLLRGYETELSNLGVKQTPQEYLIFGQGGTLFRFVTSSDAMTLATDKLREELAKNTDVLRGHYNIPTDFGYQPPTVWEYYAKTGSQQMGPVNYPWNFGTVDASGKPTLGHVPTGAATDMPTTLSLSNTLYGTFGANTQATSANTTALNQLTQKLGLNPELVYARSPIRPAEGKPTGFSHEIVGGGLGADMTGTYLPRMQGQDVFQIEGIPQVNSSLSGISLRMQSVVGNTDRLSMPAWTSVSLQAQMVGLLARMIPILLQKQIINVTMPPSGGGGGGGSSGFGTTSPATSAVGSGSAMVGASRVSSVRMA